MKIIKKDIIINFVRKIVTKIVLKNQIFPSNITLASNFIYTQDIEGDYLEFGCFRGESFIDAYKNIFNAEVFWQSNDRKKKAFSKNVQNLDFYIKKYNRKFFGFDSFKGLPKPEGIDLNHHLFKEGRYDCSKEEFVKIIKRAKLDLSKIKLVEGFYEDSLTQEIKQKLDLNKAAIVMIDCDLYKSTIKVLNFITDLLQEGTIIIFDDWFNYKSNPNKGEQKACYEWLNNNSNIKLIEYGNNLLTQKMFIVNIIK